MKRVIIITLLCVIICQIFSCDEKEYTNKLSCSEISESLKREISVPEGEFSEYNADEIKFFFPNGTIYDDITIIFSKDPTDICELGILHAQNESDAQILLKDAKAYIKNLQEEKREFLSNYAPEEIEKLNSAEARKFGNYVIFTVSALDEKREIFSNANEILTKQ